MKWMILWVCTAWTTQGVTLHDKYTVTPINTYGMYPERLENIRLVRAEWRLVLFVDVKNLEDQIPVGREKYMEVYDRCTSIKNIESQCNVHLHKQAWEAKMAEAEEKLRKLNELAGEVSSGAALQFVGSASHFLLETWRAEDEEYFNKEIDKLDRNQSKLTKTLRNQTRSTSSKLRELRDVVQIHQTQIDNNGTETERIIINVDDTAENKTLPNDILSLRVYAVGAINSLDNYIATIDKFIQVILMAREGKLHPSFLSENQTKVIIEEIHKSARDYELPIPQHYHRIEELTRIARMEIGHHERILVVTIRIPLVERTKYHLYQLHTYPVSKPTTDGTISRKRIKLEAPYLGLSDDNETYFIANDAYISKCVSTSYGLLCPPQLPLLGVATSNRCEISLMLNPRKETLRQCEFIETIEHESSWTRLNSVGAWLYSIDKPEALRIICEDDEDDHLETLLGTGIFYLKGRCRAKTTRITLLAVEVYYQQQQYANQPNLNMNLDKIFSELHHPDLLKSPKAEQTDTKEKFNDRHSLFGIERKLEYLGTHNHELLMHELVICFGLATLAVLIIFCGIGMLVICCPKRLFSKIKNTLCRKNNGSARITARSYVPLSEIIVPHPLDSVSAEIPH